MRICLDAGHGHKRKLPTGARGNGLVEDDWAFAFAYRLGHYLRAAGHQVVLTREEAGIVDLKERGRVARREKCDVFLSIHLNAAGSSAARGCEAYVVKAASDFFPKPLALEILAVIAAAGVPNRGIRWDSQSQYSSLQVLRSTYKSMRAILLEVGFLTNVQDAKLLGDKHWVEDLACRMAKCFRAE